MKKLSAILLAVALVVMACVPFCASAEDVVTFSLDQSNLVADDNGVLTATLKYTATGEKPYSGKIFIGIDDEKVEFVKDANGVTFADNGDISEDFEEGQEPLSYEMAGNGLFNGKTEYGTGAVLAFANAKALPLESNIVTLRLKLKDGVTADSLTFKVQVLEWMVGKSLTDVADPNAAAVELTATIGSTSSETDEPTPSETEAPTPSETEAPSTDETKAPTTKAASTTGEATPWALMATVAVAGAALVVLTTKKSK